MPAARAARAVLTLRATQPVRTLQTLLTVRPGRAGPADRSGVMLSGHTDVVPVDGQAWTRPAFEATEEGGRIYGRGTADMKGFVAAALGIWGDNCWKRLGHQPLEFGV